MSSPLDVKMGDEIIVAGETFPITGLERLPMETTAAFLEMMTQTVSTRRAPPEDGDGKRGEATLYLVNVRATPLMPVQPRIELRPVMQTPVQELECYLDGTTEVLRVLVERKKIFT